MQTPDEYENEKGELLQAIPTGRRGSHQFVPTGVEAAFIVHASVPIDIKAITAQEAESKQREEDATKAEEAFKKQEGLLKGLEEALKQAEEHANAESHPPTRGQLLAKALNQCKKDSSTQKRMKCEKLAKEKYGRPKEGKRRK